MSDDGYFIEDGSDERPRFRRFPAQQPRQFQPKGPPRRFQPAWRTERELHLVLELYRKWKAEGLSEQQMTYAIQRRLP